MIKQFLAAIVLVVAGVGAAHAQLELPANTVPCNATGSPSGLLTGCAMTGSGSVVMSVSPALVTPDLGKPSHIDLGNATNAPATSFPVCQPYQVVANNTPSATNATCSSSLTVGSIAVASGGSIATAGTGTNQATSISSPGTVGSWAQFTSGVDALFGQENVLLSGPFAPTKGNINSVGTLTGTATTGTYTGISLTGGTGTGAVATVVVTAGSVSAVTITSAGSNYTLGDVLSFTITGGSGTATVATLGYVGGIRDLHTYSPLGQTSIAGYQLNESIGFDNSQTPYALLNWDGFLCANLTLKASYNTVGLHPLPIQCFEGHNAFTDLRADATTNPVTFYVAHLADVFANGNNATSSTVNISSVTGDGTSMVVNLAAVLPRAPTVGDTIIITGNSNSANNITCTVTAGTGGANPATTTQVACINAAGGTGTASGTLTWLPTIDNTGFLFNNNGTAALNAGLNMNNRVAKFAIPANGATAGNNENSAVYIYGSCPTPTNTTAGSFIVNKLYSIVSVGTTDFTLIGAASNTVGVQFLASGVGSGTGTASGAITCYGIYESSTVQNLFNGRINAAGGITGYGGTINLNGNHLLLNTGSAFEVEIADGSNSNLIVLGDSTTTFTFNSGTNNGTGWAHLPALTATGLTVNGNTVFNGLTSTSAATWSTVSPIWNALAATLNDTTGSNGGVTQDVAYSIQGPTFTNTTGGAANVLATATTLFIGAPTCGTGWVSCTNLYALNTNGIIHATGGFAGPGAFTTLSASSTVSGTGFSNYLASPPAIGGSAPAAGTFTQVTPGITANPGGYVHGITVLCNVANASGTTLSNTGNLGTETNLAACKVPAGMMGTQASLRVTAVWYRNATTTDVTTYTVRHSTSSGAITGTAVTGTNQTSGNVSLQTQDTVHNTTASTQIIYPNMLTPFTASASAPTAGGINTANDNYINFNCTNATTAGDVCGIYSYTVEMIVP